MYKNRLGNIVIILSKSNLFNIYQNGNIDIEKFPMYNLFPDVKIFYKFYIVLINMSLFGKMKIRENIWKKFSKIYTGIFTVSSYQTMAV